MKINSYEWIDEKNNIVNCLDLENAVNARLEAEKLYYHVRY